MEVAVQKKTIEVFEPAMCCSTGVCGPDVPQDLVTFSADVDWVRRNGAEVYRYNLASTPVAFTNRAEVLDFMKVSGSEGLPLVLVDGPSRWPAATRTGRTWRGGSAVPFRRRW